VEDIIKKTHKIEVDSRSESVRKHIFIDALEYVKNILEMSSFALEFELEKAGEPHKLSPAKIRKKISGIEKREREVFGKKVIEVPEEFSFCFNFILKNHQAKKNSLGKTDRDKMRDYLHKIQESYK